MCVSNREYSVIWREPVPTYAISVVIGSGASVNSVNHSKWRVTIRGNWSDSSSDSDTKSSVQTACFWRWFTQVNLD